MARKLRRQGYAREGSSISARALEDVVLTQRTRHGGQTESNSPALNRKMTFFEDGPLYEVSERCSVERGAFLRVTA
jgi:hypothetical protein